MGRNPIPDIRKVIDNKRRAGEKREPRAKSQLLPYDSDLPKGGAALYNKIKKQAAADKILRLVDSPALGINCATYSMLVRAARACDKSMVYMSKSGNPVVNPNVWIFSTMSKAYIKSCEQLGLTPIGRAKMALAIDDNEEDWNEMIQRRLDRADKKRKA